jgi:hypothetical protein
VPRAKFQRSSTTTETFPVQTRSLYEVADPVSPLVEALGSRRPRTLVKTEAGRAKVLDLLEDFERTPGPGGMDYALIRRELGLPPAT